MFPRPDSIRPMLMSVSVKTCFWERLRAWRSSRSCATTPRTTGSLYRSFFRRMVQRYVKFGNFRSPVAASFAALQKVRSAPPVTGFLSSTFCCSLSAVRCPLSAVRCPLSAVRCSLFAVCRSPFAATARHHNSPTANSRCAGRLLSGKPAFVRICAESVAYVCQKEINVILFGFRRCRNGIFVYICTNKQR